MPDFFSLDRGVDFILLVQGFSPSWDIPFKLLSLLGNEGFYLFLLPFVYWCVDRRTGTGLTLLFLVSAYFNSVAKVLAAQPRPFEYDPRVKPIAGAGGFGFPSGHTQHSVVVWGYLALRLKRPTGWGVAAFLIGAIPFSRIYLGVHFPADLLGGYLLGALLLLASAKLSPLVEAFIFQRGPAARIAAALLFPAAMVLFAPAGDASCITAGSALMGTSIGFVLERRWVGFETRGPLWKRLLRLVIGMAVSLAIWAGLRSVFVSLEPESLYRIIRYGLLGLWAALGAPWLFLKLSLVEVTKPAHEVQGLRGELSGG